MTPRGASLSESCASGRCYFFGLVRCQIILCAFPSKNILEKNVSKLNQIWIVITLFPIDMARNGIMMPNQSKLNLDCY